MEDMRSMMRASLGASLRGLRVEDRLAAAWPVAAGVAMAGHGELVGYEQGRVRILVREVSWLHQMRAMGGALERSLEKVSGVPVKAIDFSVAGLREGRRG